MLVSPFPSYILGPSAQIPISKGNLLYSGVTLGKEYMVRFKVLATRFHDAGPRWTSVLLFTTGAKEGHGSKILAVFFKNENKKLHLSVNTQSSFQELVRFKVPDIPTSVWTDVIVRQQERGGGHVIEVMVNGEMIGSVVNGDPFEFRDVKVYAAKGFNAQPGFIKDFSFH